jgi:hypothetical protein
MTAASFADDMIGGGGKYAAVFHIAGMPWAVTTSTELVAALSDPNRFGTNSQKQQHAYRRLLFGEQWVAGAPQSYPSDHVQIIPSLDPDLGKQSIDYDESKGLSGGGWSVKFGRDAHGAEYSHFRDGAVPGTYDGLDVMPDPIFDSSIKTGILAADWDGTDEGEDTITWENDTGLLDLVVAKSAASKPVYVWSQNSCIGLDDDTLGTFTANGYSGCLRTVREPLYLTQADTGATMLASGPATSIIGMGAVLWFVPMTDAGAIAGLPTAGDLTDLSLYTLPVIFRSGPVKPNPTCDPKQWKVSCGFLQDNMNVNVPLELFDGELKGYMFHRTTAALSSVVQRPHLEIYEWDGAAYVTTAIWLCAPSSAVSFDNKTDALTALNVALGTRGPNSDAEVNAFTASFGGLEIDTPAAINGHPTFVNGPLAWILYLGYANTGHYYDAVKADTPSFETYFQTGKPTDTAWSGQSDVTGWLYVWDLSNGDAVYWQKKIRGGMKYYYQWNWMDEDLALLGWDTATSKPKDFAERELDRYPLSYYDTAAPNYRLRFKGDFDATKLAVDEYVTIGGKGAYRRFKGKIKTIGDNYVEITNDTLLGGVRALEVMTYSPLEKPLWGEPMLYWPVLHDDHWFAFFAPGDPHRVSQALDMETSSLKEMFLGLLGDITNGMDLPRRSRLHHVPDAWADTYDMRELIDWDRLEQLAPSSVPGQTFRLQLGAAQNVLRLFLNVLLNLGIRQTWGYSEVKRAWVMSFEPIGQVNAAKALLNGRVLDNSNLESTAPRGVHGNTWLYHTIHAKFNYDGNTPGVDITVPNRTGRAMMSSGNKTLNIDDKILQVEPAMEESYIDGLLQMLHSVNSSQPSASSVGTATSLPLAVVGGDCLLTSELVYDLFAGARGVTQRGALITSVATEIGRDNRRLALALKFRLAPGAKAIGPSLRLVDANMSRAGTVVTITGLATDPANNEFQNPLYSPNGLTDLAYFGCIDYNPATDTRKLRDCSCAKYAVIIVEENTTNWDVAGAGRNMFTGRLRGHTTDTLTLDDVNNGRCRIDIDADEGEFDDTGTYVVYFCDWDDADIQPCQEVYGWLGNEDGLIIDVDAAESRGMSWSG